MFAPIVRDRLYKGIVYQITQSIMTGQMRPGDQLPTESELAEQFAVSRTVVREAIKALSLQGLVEVTPGRGSFVTRPPVEIVISSLLLMLKLEDHSLEDLISARRLIEVPIARLAAERAGPSNVEALAKCLQGMHDALDEPEVFLAHDTAFHAELARATQNMVLSVLAQPIILMMHAFRQAMGRVPDMAQHALGFHERLYKAVALKDGITAEQIMREHLQQVAEDTEQARSQGLLDEATLPVVGS